MLPILYLILSIVGFVLLAALVAFWVWTTFFRRYRIHKVVYGSEEVKREFQDTEALSWPIPRTLLTAKQFVTAFNDFPAVDLSYKRHTFPCAIWPELGVVAYDEVFPKGKISPDESPIRPLAGEKGIYIFVCPLACNTHVRCMRRSLDVLLRAGYRCYALVTRGCGEHFMDAKSQKVYLDECWNLQDMFEFVRYLANNLGTLPPIHLCGHSLGGMRVAHFVAQVAKLVRKQADETAGREPVVFHDGDVMIRHNWRGYDNEATRKVAMLLKDSLASCDVLFPHYDPTQNYLSLLRAPRPIDWVMHTQVKTNEAALKVYLREALLKSTMEGRDPREVDSKVLSSYVDSEVERVINLAETKLRYIYEFNKELIAPITYMSSATDYDTVNVVTVEELREIAGFTRVSNARVLYFGVADDTLASDVFPHDYTAQGIDARVLAVQLNRGEHVGTVLTGGKDVVSYFVLRMADAQLGGKRGGSGPKVAPAEPGREK